MSLPTMPSTHTWVTLGPGLAKGGRVALYVADDAEVWAWDEDTNTRITDLLDVNGDPVTLVPVQDGWIGSGNPPGIGVPVAVQYASFSVGQYGKRMATLPVQTFKNAASALAPTDTQVATLTADTGSSTRAALNTAIGDEAADAGSDLRASLDGAYDALGAAAAAAAGKVDKGTLVYYAGDYASPQACLDAAPAGAIVKLNTATITTALSITKAVNIVGGGNRNTLITANGCDGFVVANGVGDVTIQRLAVKQATRYTDATNAFVGVKILGDSTHRPSVHTYRDLYLDGFETGIQGNYLWTSRFDNVQTAFGLIGIDAYGLSENNTVTGGNLVVGNGTQTRLAGSACIRLNGQVSRTDTTALVSEGWVVSDSLMYGGDYGVYAKGYGNYQIANCILDAIQQAGVYIINNGTAYGGHALVQGNYIAFAGNAASALGGVEIANTVAGVRPSRIIGNDILVYAGGSVNYGVHTIASVGAVAAVESNVISGVVGADIRFESSGSSAIGNRCLTPVANLSLTKNIHSAAGQLNLVSDNVADVYITGASSPNTYSSRGGLKVMPAVAAPTTGTWVRGDRVVHSAPAVGAPKGWVCTVGGSPGTWVSEGNL